MIYKGVDWSILRYPGLTDDEFKRLLDLDEKQVEGMLTWRERWEEAALLRKMDKAVKKEQEEGEDGLSRGHVGPQPGPGVDRLRPVRFTLPAESLHRHAYLLGSTGCGKTSLLLRFIDYYLASQESLVVLDLRGDLIDRILKRIA